ncbi:MAG: hypothetical protein RBT41_05300 [Clostridia bacterium]|nr:hypothetical protein [Clostridia bacterium]
MDEDKILNLMEKMYGEMQKGFTELRGDITDLKSGQTKLESRMDKLDGRMIIFENDLKPKVEAALDGYKSNTDRLDRIENKVDKLTEIVIGHDVAIEVLKRAK